MTGEPRFVADENLGRLARWLRVAGVDTLHRNPADDAWLLETATGEGRILLTRDRRFVERDRLPPPLRPGAARARVHRVEGFETREQLAEVCRAFRIDPLARAFTRCPRCNGAVEPIPREAARNRVPARSFEIYERFFRCPGCDQVYWEGEHVARSRSILEVARARAGFS